MIIIRQIRIDEVGKLQKLNNILFLDNQNYDNDLDLTWPFSEKAKNYFTNALKKSDACCLFAHDNKKLVGYLIGVPKNIGYRKSKYFEITNILVIPEYQSKGIGAKLLNACKKWAKEKGFQNLFVNSYFKNSKAIDFYKKNAFLEIDISLEKSL